ncbi:PAS domain-containing hybrid sensor histidine kinase/response regulator [Malonomonas rubra]|nr:PAS domain S-box protein [Malonomonas rubra]
MRKTHNLALRAIKIAAIYALFGLLWILFSDQLLLLVTNDANYLAQLQTIKGWFFIFVTAALLFVLVYQALVAQDEGNTSLRRSEQHFRTLVDTIPDLIWLKDAEGVYLSCNATFERFFGARQEEIVGKTDYDFIDRELADFFREKDHRAMAANRPCDNEEWITFADNGQRALLLTTKMPMHDIDGKIVGVLGVGRDITKLRQAENALRQSEETFRKLFEDSSDAILLIDETGVFVECNQAALGLLKMERDEFLLLPPARISPEFQPDGQRSAEAASEMIALAYSKGLHRFDWTCINAEGGEFVVEVSLMPVTIKGQTMLHTTWRDITARKRAEKEKAKLESQLQQAQKMESVGRLAGGVAHDFNNMLGVILGHAELGLKRLDPTHKVCTDLRQIKESAERSADLTRQLLAFARQQTVTPKVIDLNEAISNMITMLQRLIGEDIELIFQQAAETCLIHMDPSQIDQLLANLCVNARDAIEDTGKIEIETHIFSVDADYCHTNPEATPGDYVCLAISDDGKGMNLETQAHIFEPFFTTKEQGKGTGLGLATVYGIVKQNKGFIDISSESGKGTIFSVYLPLFTGTKAQKRSQPGEQKALRGHETILLVEDEAAILNITATMLEEQGHTVLRAGTPGQAMEIAREHPGEIDLLMTDVIMPEMNGRELAKNVLALRPGTKRLFMSGYTADVIAHHGVLDEGVHFIQKPFSLPDMTAMVRNVLDEDQ